jgi:hypothetical protein
VPLKWFVPEFGMESRKIKEKVSEKAKTMKSD